ncbi:hypothetical protein [Yersinia phage vB_YenM_P778]
MSIELLNMRLIANRINQETTLEMSVDAQLAEVVTALRHHTSARVIMEVFVNPIFTEKFFTSCHADITKIITGKKWENKSKWYLSRYMGAEVAKYCIKTVAIHDYNFNFAMADYLANEMFKLLTVEDFSHILSSHNKGA